MKVSSFNFNQVFDFSLAEFVHCSKIGDVLLLTLKNLSLSFDKNSNSFCSKGIPYFFDSTFNTAEFVFFPEDVTFKFICPSIFYQGFIETFADTFVDFAPNNNIPSEYNYMLGFSIGNLFDEIEFSSSDNSIEVFFDNSLLIKAFNDKHSSLVKHHLPNEQARIKFNEKFKKLRR